MILLTINPDLVSFDEITIKSIESIPNEDADEDDIGGPLDEGYSLSPGDINNYMQSPPAPVDSPPVNTALPPDDTPYITIPGVSDDDYRHEGLSERDLLDPVVSESDLGNN